MVPYIMNLYKKDDRYVVSAPVLQILITLNDLSIRTKILWFEQASLQLVSEQG